MNCNGLFTYPVHVLRLSFTAKRSRYSTDCGYKNLGCLSVGGAEMETKNGDRVNLDVLQYRSTSLNAVPPEKLVSYASSAFVKKASYHGKKTSRVVCWHR